MSTHSEFRRYIDEHAALPADVTLGHIAWFDVKDGNYDSAHLEAEFSRLSLNPAFLPGPINPADAFEKASKEVNGHKYTYNQGPADFPAEILTREASRNNGYINVKLMREVKDAKQVTLHYNAVGELVFYRPREVNGVVDHTTARIRTSLDQSIDGHERNELMGLLHKFDAAYHRHANFHDGQKIRTIVRSYLLYLNAIQMKPSVYFVHESRSDELRRLKEFMDGLPVDGTRLTLLPLPDLPSLRQEVTDSFQEQAEKDLYGVVSEITKLRSTRKGPIKLEAFTKVKKQYDEVMSKAGEYTRTLKCSQDRTSAAAEVALDALMVLQADIVKAMDEGQVA